MARFTRDVPSTVNFDSFNLPLREASDRNSEITGSPSFHRSLASALILGLPVRKNDKGDVTAAFDSEETAIAVFGHFIAFKNFG